MGVILACTAPFRRNSRQEECYGPKAHDRRGPRRSYCALASGFRSANRRHCRRSQGDADESAGRCKKRMKPKRSRCSTRERVDFETATSIHFASISATGRLLPLATLTQRACLGWIARPLRAPPKDLGLDVYDAAQKPEGEITEVSYLSLRPGDDPNGWAPKVSFVTRVGDLGCGVGYYK